MDVPITLKAQVKSQRAKKTVIYCVLLAEERKCAEGEVIAIRAPWGKNSP
jgi:hypothetical protein